MSPKNGFTLVELMIVVAIMSLLSAIAIPSYTRYLVQCKRVEAVGLLVAVEKYQTSYFSSAEQYYPPDAPEGGNNVMNWVTANQYFGLPTTETKLGWNFFNYHGHGGPPGSGTKTAGYHVKVFNDLDTEIVFMDAYEVKANYPVEPHSSTCPDRIPFLLVDDLRNFTVNCP